MTSEKSMFQPTYSTNSTFNPIALPKNIHKWLYVKQAQHVFCVQDIVHIGVKLKSRLLKPSIILPLGRYIVTSSHFNMLVKTLSKAKHGLKAKDLDHHDKQNFDAVQNIIRASQLLQDMPDALGTQHYVAVMRCAIYSYLDKGLPPQQRLTDMWYAVFFFMCYWRQWIL